MIFISDPSLTHLDLIIWFSLYLIKVACFETRHPRTGVCVGVPKCQYYKNVFECRFSIIIVNCFHVFVIEIPTLRAYIHWTLAFEGASNVCLFTNKMKFEKQIHKFGDGVHGVCPHNVDISWKYTWKQLKIFIECCNLNKIYHYKL